MTDDIRLSTPRVGDGAAIHRLVAACPPLDLNSVYAYLLLCAHFPETCVRAARGEETVGFVSAYRPPREPAVLFVWQVAVAAAERGRGLGRRMLRALLARPAAAQCTYLETTVSPSNAPSLTMFHRLAEELRAPVETRTMFEKADFGDAPHEPETLIRIGPYRC